MAIETMTGHEAEGAVAELIPGSWDTSSHTLNTTSYGLVTGLQGTGQALEIRASSARSIFKNLTTRDTYIALINLKIEFAPGSENIFFNFGDTGTVQMALYIDASANVKVKRGTTTLATASQTMPLNTRVTLEFKTVIHNTTGSYELRFNGTNVASDTGVDTQMTGAAQITSFRIYNPGNDIIYDEVVMVNTTGTHHNSFIGDNEIVELTPTGDSSVNAWTAQGAGSKFVEVDEQAHDSDTTYNHSVAASTDKQRHTMSNLATSVDDVAAVKVDVVAKKTDAGGGSVHLLIFENLTEGVGATQGVTTSYDHYVEIWDDNPDTSAAWTVAEVDAVEAGYGAP